MTDRPVLSGQRCQCAACSLYFSSDYAFCKHRTGLYTERRCLTEAEMLAKGMALVGSYWISERRAPHTIPADAIPSEAWTHSGVVEVEALPTLGVWQTTGETRQGLSS